MRSRLILKLISTVVVLVLSVIGAREMSSGGSSTSLINPANVARNGLSGVCANEQAVGAAGGGSDEGAPATAISPNELTQLQSSDPSGLRALEGAAGGSLSCPTTTTGP